MIEWAFSDGNEVGQDNGRDIVAIDPGTESSAWVRLDSKARRVKGLGIESNSTMLRLASDMAGELRIPHFAIEMVESFGLPVGREVFETVFWTGRFSEATDGFMTRIGRRDVKLHLCKTVRGANDATVRQALVDRFGPGRRKACGIKKEPGPLYGVKTHIWSALGVAVTFFDLARESGDG